MARKRGPTQPAPPLAAEASDERPATIRIILADDYPAYADSLRTLLARDPNIRIVGTAADGNAAVEAAWRLKPDVVVMDVRMPGLNGIEATRQIVRDVPGARVLALSMYPDKTMITQMLRAGASGYILKDCAGEELIAGIRAAAAGSIYLCAEAATTTVARALNQDFRGSKSGPS